MEQPYQLQSPTTSVEEPVVQELDLLHTQGINQRHRYYNIIISATALLLHTATYMLYTTTRWGAVITVYLTLHILHSCI